MFVRIRRFSGFALVEELRRLASILFVVESEGGRIKSDAWLRPHIAAVCMVMLWYSQLMLLDWLKGADMLGRA